MDIKRGKEAERHREKEFLKKKIEKTDSESGIKESIG